MGTVVLGCGAYGALVHTLQTALRAGGFDIVPDALYGTETVAAVRSFQESRGLAVTGEADRETWEALTDSSPPSLEDKALQLIAAFEGHEYTFSSGNFDGAGITWGIVGFTLASGSLQLVLEDALAADSRLVERAFGRDTAELLELIRRPMPDQIAWASRISLGSHRATLVEPWRTHFLVLGRNPAVQALQRRRVALDSFAPARLTAAAYDLTTDMGITLCYEIHVREGGIAPEAARAVARGYDGCTCERDLRVLVANAVADASRPAAREDVRRKLITIATGVGTVHGDTYQLRCWGLHETREGSDVAPPFLPPPQGPGPRLLSR